jgi:hypothetical protein
LGGLVAAEQPHGAHGRRNSVFDDRVSRIGFIEIVDYFFRLCRVSRLCQRYCGIGSGDPFVGETYRFGGGLSGAFGESVESVAHRPGTSHVRARFVETEFLTERQLLRRSFPR